MRGLYGKSEGFTLLEIMIVVAMVGILAAIGVTTLQGVLLKQQTSSAAQEIQSLLNQARSMARSTAVPATVTLVQVAAAPGGTISATIGAPVNWTRTVSLGPGTDYKAVGLVGVALGPFTFAPRGTVTPAGFNLSVQDGKGQAVAINVGLLGDIYIQ
jgi:prepilin-type N-terminal cleavage/methylation domain-containing protein